MSSSIATVSAVAGTAVRDEDGSDVVVVEETAGAGVQVQVERLFLPLGAGLQGHE